MKCPHCAVEFHDGAASHFIVGQATDEVRRMRNQQIDKVLEKQWPASFNSRTPDGGR